MKMSWRNLRKQSFLPQAILLAGLEAFLFVALMPFLWYFGPAADLAAAGLAAILCTAGALLSLWIHHFFSDPKSALTSTLLGTAMNMGIPLVFGLAIHLRGGPLSQAGFLYYLLFFYLFTLAVKTIMTLPLTPQTATNDRLS